MLYARPSSLHLASALLTSLLVFAGAQSQTERTPKLKDFGSSLKKLKWDATQNAAVQRESSSKTTTNSNGEDVVRVETSLVVNDVLVLDIKGQPVNGLTANDFEVTEDGTPQQVGMLSLGDNATVPRSIVLIIDYGCSQLPFLKASVAAAKTLIEKFQSSDRIAIVTDDVELLIGFTNDKKKLNKKLDELIRRTGLNPNDRDFVLERFQRSKFPFGRGFQYSALMAVLREAFDQEDQRPIIIFQTDGSEAQILRNPVVDTGIAPGLPPDLMAQAEANLKHRQQFSKRNPREFSLADVYRATEASRATIYTVVPGLRFVGLKPEERPVQMRAFLNRNIVGFDSANYRKQVSDYLNRVTDETLGWEADNLAKLQSSLAVLSTISGGWIDFFDQPSQADEIYSRILSDINRRYVVGYYPTNRSHNGRRRMVKITVRDHPEYIVMGHRAYYAMESDQ